MVNSKKYAVVVAGGKGVRMGAGVPKQFLPFLGKPLLCYAVEAFIKALPDCQIILVVPSDHLSSVQIVLRTFLGNTGVQLVAGGETRFHSVQNGLKLVKNDGVVFVHDAARPLINTSLILRCFAQAREKGSAIPVVPVSESIRMVEGNNHSKPLNRDHLRLVQTPQTFKTELILPAFNRDYRPEFTDEASVVEANGGTVNLIEGEFDNIKITTSIDLIIAEALLKVRK